MRVSGQLCSANSILRWKLRGREERSSWRLLASSSYRGKGGRAVPGQHAGDPGTAAAPTDLAASRSAVLTLELRYFTRHRDFTAIRSPRGTAGLRSSYSLPAASSAPHSPPRRCEQPASHRRYTTPGSAPRPAGTEDPGAAVPPSPPRSSPRSAPGRWRPWPELSAARGSARPEWLRLNGSNMATSWKLPSAGTGRGAGRGGSGRRAVTVPSRGRPLRSGPGVPRAAACGALREVRAVRSVPLRSAGDTARGAARSYESSAVTAVMPRVPPGPRAATTADAHRGDGGLRAVWDGCEAACRGLVAVALPAAYSKLKLGSAPFQHEARGRPRPSASPLQRSSSC